MNDPERGPLSLRAQIEQVIATWRVDSKEDAREGVKQWHTSNREYFGRVNAALTKQECADALAAILASPPVAEQDQTLKFHGGLVQLLQEAQVKVRASSLYARFIDGTPLENDIACWMAEFALDTVRVVSAEMRRAALASPQEPQEPELSVAAVEAWLCEQGLIAKDGPVTKKPGHGSCCTCQDCGFNYDDCECDRNARLVSWRTFLAALSPSPAAAPEQTKEKKP